MRPFRSAVIINDHVLHANVPAGSHWDTYDSAGIGRGMRYISGTGEFAYKEVDQGLTLDDAILEQSKAPAASIVDILEYNSRTGRFEHRNAEIPLKPGQVSGGLWDVNGVRDPAEAAEKILESGSNVVKSVVSVPRDMAAELRLVDKESWQRLMRETWYERVAEWGVIAPQDIRAVFAYHTDQPANIHVHITTWDASGRFTGEQQIPKSEMMRSGERLRRAVLREYQDERVREKGIVRDAAMMRVRQNLGIRIRHDDVLRLELKAAAVGVSFAYDKSPIPEPHLKTIEDLVSRAAAAMPENGVGRAGYRFQSLETKAAINLAVGEMKKRDPSLRALIDRYENLSLVGADMLAYRGSAAEKYVSDQMSELKDRIRNVVSKQAAFGNVPWMRDAAVVRELEAARAIVEPHLVSSSSKTLHMAAKQVTRGDEVSESAVRRGVADALERNPLAADRYREAAMGYCRRASSSPLQDRQINLIYEKIDSSLVSELTQRCMKPVEAAAQERAVENMAARSATIIERTNREAGLARTGGATMEQLISCLAAGGGAVQESIKPLLFKSKKTPSRDRARDRTV